MEYKPCYDDVKDMVDEASAQFGEGYELNRYKFNQLDEICEIVDELVLEFECECVDIAVDDMTKQLTIAIECDEMILIGGRTHEFFKLIAMLDSFVFSKAKRDTLRVEFNLNNMWERA